MIRTRVHKFSEERKNMTILLLFIGSQNNSTMKMKILMVLLEISMRLTQIYLHKKSLWKRQKKLQKISRNFTSLGKLVNMTGMDLVTKL